MEFKFEWWLEEMIKVLGEFEKSSRPDDDVVGYFSADNLFSYYYCPPLPSASLCPIYITFKRPMCPRVGGSLERASRFPGPTMHGGNFEDGVVIYECYRLDGFEKSGVR